VSLHKEKYVTIKIKKLGAVNIDEFMALIRLFEDVFEMKNFIMPDEKHFRHLLIKDSFIVFAALQDDRVVGGVTAYSLMQYYTTRNAVFLYDLAVDKAMHRQGVGRKLLNALKEYCREENSEVMFLEADETDNPAIEFYRSTGATESKGYFFSYPFK
jgi:GNAT superfamily N-acetyltransferase